jgi:hypothetical protein
MPAVREAGKEHGLAGPFEVDEPVGISAQAEAYASMAAAAAGS